MLPSNAALLIVDFQKAIDDPSWMSNGPRNNPDAEATIARLLAAWRASDRPIIHIRHDSTEPNSAYRPGQPGHDFKAEAVPIADEAVIPKKVNSAFIGTDLELQLQAPVVESADPQSAGIGSEVVLRFGDDAETETFVIGRVEQGGSGIEIITPTSPLGAVLLGARPGDEVSYRAANGKTLTVTLVAVQA